MIHVKYNTHTSFRILLLLIAMAFAVIYFLSPLEADDYWFLEGTQGIDNPIERFVAACATMQERWYTDTGRLGNIISPLFLALFPKAVFNIISAICIYIIVIYSCRLSHVILGSSRSFILLAIIVFCLPWYDYLFCVTFAINYVWTLALSVMTSYYIIYGKYYKPWQITIICIMAFSTAWMHEGIGVPLSIAILSILILRFVQNRLSYSFVIEVLALCAGACMICLSPVFWNRAETAVSNIYKFPVKELLLQIGPGALMFGLFILSLFVSILHRRHRHIALEKSRNKEMILFFFTMVIMSAIIMIKYYNGPRTSAGLILFAGIGVVYLSRFWNIKMPCRNILKAIICVAIFINLISAIAMQYKLRQEYKEVLEHFNKSTSGTIYFDISYPCIDLTLFKTTVRQFHERGPREELSHYLDPKKHLVILPQELEDLDSTKVVTTSASPEVYRYGNYFVMPGNRDIKETQIKLQTLGGRWQYSRFRLDEFVDKKGMNWTLIMPHIQVLDPDIELTDIIL